MTLLETKTKTKPKTKHSILLLIFKHTYIFAIVFSDNIIKMKAKESSEFTFDWSISYNKLHDM